MHEEIYCEDLIDDKSTLVQVMASTWITVGQIVTDAVWYY